MRRASLGVSHRRHPIQSASARGGANTITSIFVGVSGAVNVARMVSYYKSSAPSGALLANFMRRDQGVGLPSSGLGTVGWAGSAPSGGGGGEGISGVASCMVVFGGV